MGFLKNMAIRSLARKRSRQLVSLIDLKLSQATDAGVMLSEKQDAERFVKDALCSFIAETKALGGGFGINVEASDNWKLLFYTIICQQVKGELAYDKTVGTEKDRELIADIVEKELLSWRNRIAVNISMVKI